MSIFDIFGFKSAFKEVFTKERFQEVRDLIKSEIIKQIKSKLEGSEKMDQVVDKVVAWVQEHVHSKNGIVQWVIDTLLIPNVRILTQAIYDDLKEVIKGL